jgi:hypothetical protein
MISERGRKKSSSFRKIRREAANLFGIPFVFGVAKKPTEIPHKFSFAFRRRENFAE